MDSVIPLHQPAPLFSLPDLAGNVYRLEEWRRRIIILNFWSAECPWAEQGDRELLSYLPGWQGRVLWWTIAANANEPAEMLQRVARQRGLPLLLHDAQHNVADLYGAQTTPHLFVIDPAGLLRYQGALNDITFRQRQATRFYLCAAVTALLEGKSPDPEQTPPYGCTIVRYAG